MTTGFTRQANTNLHRIRAYIYPHARVYKKTKADLKAYYSFLTKRAVNDAFALGAYAQGEINRSAILLEVGGYCSLHRCRA